MTKSGIPSILFTKWVNPYNQTIYPYDEMSNPLHKKITHPLMTKSGTPSILITKWVNPYNQTIYPYDVMSNPYIKKLHSHWWQNQEPLVSSLQNE